MDTLKIAYYGLLVLNLITLLINKKNLNKIYYWFIPLIALGIITQMIGDLVNHNLPPQDRKVFMFHIYQPIEYVLLSIFYLKLLWGKIVKNLIIISIPLFVLFCIYYYSTGLNAYVSEDFTNFTVEALLISIFVSIFFFQLFHTDEYVALRSYPAFWINTGNLFFYGGNLLVMGFHYYVVQKDRKLAEELLSINHYLNLLLYIIYLIGFSCSRTNKK